MISESGATQDLGLLGGHNVEDPDVRVSVVIPMLDEAGTVEALLDGCQDALEGVATFEICVVNDGSTDATADVLSGYRAARPDLRMTVVTHVRPAGQSAAVHSGVRASRGSLICTLDGDGQNPPSELPKLLAPLLASDRPKTLGLVAGQRLRRQDPPHKLIASRMANGLRRALLKDGTRDTGCGLKAFRRDAFLALPFFNHMHRYLPALFQRDGWDVAHCDVAHAERSSGRSKYTNIGRAIVGLTDLLGVAWLVRRRRSIAPGDVSVSFDEASSP
ncbi:MAG: glycosyltransferase family 2 protein [Pseudomonadota bacterium]